MGRFPSELEGVNFDEVIEVLALRAQHIEDETRQAS